MCASCRNIAISLIIAQRAGNAAVYPSSRDRCAEDHGNRRSAELSDRENIPSLHRASAIKPVSMFSDRRINMGINGKQLKVECFNIKQTALMKTPQPFGVAAIHNRGIYLGDITGYSSQSRSVSRAALEADPPGEVGPLLCVLGRGMNGHRLVSATWEKK